MKQLLMILLLLTAGISYAQKDKKLTDQTVNQASIAAHLKFLSSDALEGRDTPSKGLEVAAEYLRTQLELYGVKPFDEYPDYFQTVNMKKVIKPNQGVISFDSSQFELEKDFLLLNGSNIDLSKQVVSLEYATPEEIEAADVKGKIIVATAGDGTDMSPRAWFGLVAEKREAAKAAGALALIELYNSPQIPWSLLVRYLSGKRVELDYGQEEDDFTSIWVNNANQSNSPAFTKVKRLSINISGASVERFDVANIVGYVEGSDAKLKEEYVVYSAHYDHVGIGQPDSTGDAIYNGARDNAIGTVTVLEAAKNIGKYPTKRSALFIFFAGEEKGLLGSEWYVEHSAVPLNEIVYCFNSDGGGYNNTNLATVIGLDRTTAEELLIEAIEAYGLKAGDDENYKDQGLFDRSDNVSFAKKGIPAPTFTPGMDAFDDSIFKYYHQPSDEFESLDMDYMYTFYRAYVLSGRMIGNMKETPFWKEGDKYYDVGKKLYK
ncbi:M28 family metallopeptidase [Marinoscillum pacificum]|uniref:M28 family metallopeptidase n=1 Tax=Marinoscillum pacificum TaxID=392723 RepID=UPI002157A22A|nr:M28 family peptidase [Marinoscillum pacificum]